MEYVDVKFQSSSLLINSFGLTMAHVEESSLSKEFAADVTVGSADGDGDDMVDNECAVWFEG